MTDARSVQIRDCHRQWLTECLRSSVLQRKMARSHLAMKGPNPDTLVRCQSLNGLMLSAEQQLSLPGKQLQMQKLHESASCCIEIFLLDTPYPFGNFVTATAIITTSYSIALTSSVFGSQIMGESIPPKHQIFIGVRP